MPVIFTPGESSVCHTVSIRQDDECEVDHIEDFISTLEYGSGAMPIIVARNRTKIEIDDSNEKECGKYTAEPLIKETLNKGHNNLCLRSRKHVHFNLQKRDLKEVPLF